MTARPHGAGISVDGPRPAVEWVTSLPPHWLTDGERLVLLAIALDSYDGHTSAPGRANMAQWTGHHESSNHYIVRRLAVATETRPALIKIMPSKGRRPTAYRLLRPPVPVDNHPQPVDQPDTLPSVDNPADLSTPPTGSEDPNLSGNLSGNLSANLYTAPTPPFPTLTTNSSSLDHSQTGDPVHNGEDQLRHITDDTAALRPEWTRGGIRSAIRQLHARGLDLETITATARAAATDTNARTPIAITWPQYQPAPPRRDPGPLCQICGLPKTRCRTTAARTADPHPWTPPGTAPPPARDIAGLITHHRKARP